MINLLSGKITGGKVAFLHWPSTLAPVLLLAALTFSAGCQTNELFPPAPPRDTNVIDATNVINVAGAAEATTNAINFAGAAEATTNATEVITLRESDVLKISFPANANLNTTQTVRRDGMITMPLIGEVKAAGKTPTELQNDLIELYSPQLVSKEVMVEVQSSIFPVYVTGMVMRPGKIESNHPITALEAVMEAGGFDYTKANLKNVVVIRREGSIMRNYKLNLKAVLQGKQIEPFNLKPNDIVYVPERFSMF